MSHRLDKEKAVNVQVLLRCRPFSEDELRCNAPQVVSCNDSHKEVSVSQTIAGKQIDRVFTFDKVFGPYSRQIDLYDQALVPIVNEVLEGFNCTIFAYGQTGTGKTYTMEGECRRSKGKVNGDLPPHAGVIPRAVKQIFQTLESQHAEYSVKVTYLELYNEEITDLLAPEEIKTSQDERQKKALPLMEDGKKGVLVRGLEEEIVTSSDEIFTLLERGSAKRRTAETLLNKQSSRSHSLFTVTIHIKESTPEGEELIKCGKLNLVDLAGSENIIRSGAREGRAREAGEINKSLLTLGRVITALVEHYGHIPYRDSKLTRLLRDSLGGRTKTCIIATVSPAVHCLEETLSTLDYAHRARNIKNRPEVNQKMTKVTLIKDMHGEIERLKSELHATREKSGIYVPAERYYQEECDRKARIDKIELMDVLIESKQKQLDDLQEKYDTELNRSSDLCTKLETTEKSLEKSVKKLTTVLEDLEHSQYNLKEKDFIITELKIAENALTNKALSLRSELEKYIIDNSLLFSKIGRKDQLNTRNKAVIKKFQTDLVEKLNALCSNVVSCITQQKKQIKNAEALCNSCLEFYDKSLLDLKEYVSAAKIQYVSHLETLQNDIHLQKAYINGSLEEISSSNSTHLMSFEHIMASGDGFADQTINLLQDKISNQRGEIADFVHDLRERFSKSTEYTKLMSGFVNDLLDNLKMHSSNLQDQAVQIQDVQIKQIVDFRETFETQSKLESEKFLSQIQSLLSTHIGRQNELVADKLACLSKASTENKAFFDAHTSSIEGVTNNAKRKWDDFAQHANKSSVDGADFVSFKHCRIEQEFENCVSTVDDASTLWKNTNKSITEKAKEHIDSVDALVRTMTDSNEQHDSKTYSARIAAEKDTSNNNDRIFQHLKGLTEHQHTSVSETLQTLESQSRLISGLGKDHDLQAEKLGRYAVGTFQINYKEYEPSGQTPIKSEPELPSRTAIESLRSTPMDSLLEQFRENHPYISTKEPKLCHEPRLPLSPRN